MDPRSDQVDVSLATDQMIDQDVKEQVKRQIIECHKKQTVKCRKSQRTSLDFIRLMSMVLYKQQKELNL